MADKHTHTVEREFKRLGGHVRLLHVPGMPRPYLCLTDLPGAPENDTRCVMSSNFATANKAYSHWVTVVKEWRDVG